MTRNLFIALLAASLSGVAWAQPELTMQDLQALDKQQSWSELLDKAELVKPSARTADWTTLVQGAASRVVDQIGRASHSDWRVLQTLVAVIPTAELRYPFLTSDKAYLASKAQVLEQIAAACAEDHAGARCGTMVVALADGIEKYGKGVARRIANLLPDDAGQSIHFWALAADEDKGACTEPQLRLAVLATLRNSTADRHVIDAQRAAATCFATLEQDLVEDLVREHPYPEYAKNACPVLKTHGAATTAKKKLCP